MRISKLRLEIMESLLKRHTEVIETLQLKQKLLEIKDKFNEYWLDIKDNKTYIYWCNLYGKYVIIDIDWDVIKTIDNLSDIDTRFEWYKQWVEDGYMDIINCNECCEYKEETKEVKTKKKVK